jgi:predicted transcriptional regulator
MGLVIMSYEALENNYSIQDEKIFIDGKEATDRLTELQRKQISSGVEKADKQPFDGDLKISLSKERFKIEARNNFVICFYNDFYNIIKKYNIQQKELLTLLLILKYAEFGNQVNITQKTIADELGTHKSNVSRYFKNLEASGILIKNKGSIFINPQVLSKGSLKLMTDNAELFQIAIQEQKKRNLNINF